jgi:hypothetical protein
MPPLIKLKTLCSSLNPSHQFKHPNFAPVSDINAPNVSRLYPIPRTLNQSLRTPRNSAKRSVHATKKNLAETKPEARRRGGASLTAKPSTPSPPPSSSHLAGESRAPASPELPVPGRGGLSIGGWGRSPPAMDGASRNRRRSGGAVPGSSLVSGEGTEYRRIEAEQEPRGGAVVRGERAKGGGDSSNRARVGFLGINLEIIMGWVR